MTKRELVILVSEKLGITQNEVSAIVQETLDTITDVLVDGNRIEIRNFGVFEIKRRDSRVGRNPRTGEEVPIPQKNVASFKPGKALKEWVQAGTDNRPSHLFKNEDGEKAPDAAPTANAQPETVVSSAPPDSENSDAYQQGDQQSLF